MRVNLASRGYGLMSAIFFSVLCFSSSNSKAGGLAFCYAGETEHVIKCPGGGQIRELFYIRKACDCEGKILPDAHSDLWLMCTLDTCSGATPPSCRIDASEKDPYVVIPCETSNEVVAPPCGGWSAADIGELRSAKNRLQAAIDGSSNPYMKGAGDLLLTPARDVLRSWNDPKSGCQSSTRAKGGGGDYLKALNGMAKRLETLNAATHTAKSRTTGQPVFVAPKGFPRSPRLPQSGGSGSAGIGGGAAAQGSVAHGGGGKELTVQAVGSRLASIAGDQVTRFGSTHVSVTDPNGTEITYHDDSGDGIIDWVAVTNPDGTVTLIIDTNSDGTADRQVIIAASGGTTYSGPLQSPKIQGQIADPSSVVGSNSTPGGAGIVANGIGTLSTIQSALNKVSSGIEAINGLFGDPQTRPPEAAQLSGFAKASGHAVTALRGIEALRNPSDNNKMDFAVHALGDLARVGLPAWAGQSGVTNAIPTVMQETSQAAIGQASAVLQGDEPDSSAVFAPLANFLGGAVPILGLGSVGDMVRNRKSEGTLSASQLRAIYGWREGTRRAAWYWVLGDLGN